MPAALSVAFRGFPVGPGALLASSSRDRRRSDGDRAVVGEPHLLDVVKGSYVRPGDVDDHVTRIDQHPVEGAHAFDAEIADAGIFQVAEQPVGNGADMAVRPPGSD